MAFRAGFRFTIFEFIFMSKEICKEYNEQISELVALKEEFELELQKELVKDTIDKVKELKEKIFKLKEENNNLKIKANKLE